MTHILEALRPLAVPIDSLHEDPANARKHNDRNLDAIKASLAKFSQRKPIVVQRQGMIVRAGNGTLAAAKALGWTEIAAVIVDEDDVSATGFAIADNRTAELAAWDDDVLGSLLTQLQSDDDFDHLLTGFTDAEIGQMQPPVDGLTDPDDAPAVPSKSVTQPGDFWLLGKHRLLCGDATNPDDVARVLQGEVPFQMVTDPPYGVNYDPAWRTATGACGVSSPRARNAVGRVTNDDRVDWTEAWMLFPGDVAYVWHGGMACGEVGRNLTASGLEIRAQIIWRKSRAPISRGAYHWGHEPCWYAVRTARTARWCGDRKQSTVWDIDTNRANDTGHSTQKPVECMERPMRHHGELGDVVYDPFLGSGTSIIAAVRARRRCFGLEIDPAYCDVIVERWQNHTGLSAVRRTP